MNQLNFKIIDLKKLLQSSRIRHLAKTITWRIVGTIDTMCLGWLITGNPLMGVKIGSFEIFTKMILYYLHERVWFRINLGLNRPINISTPINWTPNPDKAYVQVAFFQHEESGIRKRVKITKNGSNYVVLLSSYNKNTKERLSDIIIGDKESIENQLKIKID